MTSHRVTASVNVGAGSSHDRLNGSLRVFVREPSSARVLALKLFVVTVAPLTTWRGAT